MAWIGALIAGGAALAGDFTSSSNASNTNAANEQINQENNTAAMDRQVQSQAFNDAQANESRNWSAQQIAGQEQFQAGQQIQAENYDTEMSDTSMQRRVADLKAAGINPLLAVSQGGASTPTISPQSGSITSAAQASSSPAGAPGSIPMQNTAAAFGNLGGQISNAIQTSQTQAQIDLLKAQTDKTNEEANLQIPANAEYLKSMTGLTDQNATQAYYNTQKIQEEIYGQRLSNDQLKDIITPMQGQNLEVLKATRDALISAAQSDATAKSLNLQQLRNMNEIASSNYGKILTLLNATLQPLNTAAQIAR